MEITGRITADGQIKKLKDDRELVAFSIALSNRYKKKGTESKGVDTFVNCSYWISTKVVSILKKGSIVTVGGSIGVNAYKTNDGEYHAHLTFHCDYIQLIGSGKAGTVVLAETPKPETVDDLPF